MYACILAHVAYMRGSLPAANRVSDLKCELLYVYQWCTWICGICMVYVYPAAEYVYVYTYCTYIHIRIYIYVYTYTYKMGAFVCIHVYSRMYTYIHARFSASNNLIEL